MQTCRVAIVARQDVAVKVGHGMDGQFWRGLYGLCAVRQEWHGRVMCGKARSGKVRQERLAKVL